MTPEQYLIETARTWNTGDDHRLQLCNAALGLVGECDEYEMSGTADELGDCLYYAATLCRLLDVEGAFIDEFELFSFAGPRASAVAEAIKKHVFHGKTPSKARAVVETMCQVLRWHANAHFDGASAVMAQNIAKLRERHPDGFDPSNRGER